ncbi:MAG: TatD family hydrolase [Alkalispirochaeta sp.]
MAPVHHKRFLSDSHFHSTAMRERGINPDEVLHTFRDEFDGPLLDVAIEPEDISRQRLLSGAVPNVYYSCGLHPSRTDREDWEPTMHTIEREISSGAFHAVGETGLDWYRMYASQERQRELFHRHLVLSRNTQLPIIVHNREANEDVLDMISHAHLSTPGVMHCFSSGPEWVKPFLDAGMYISFAGNLTFKNASALREAITLVPEERLLLETDAPFLAPHPVRGQPNHPGLLRHTLTCAAELRNTSPEHLGEQVARNLATLLNVPVT